MSVITQLMPVQERIISAACVYFNTTESDLHKDIHLPEKSYKRALCSFLIREHTGESFRQIAHRLQFKDHKSVSSAFKKIDFQKHRYNYIRHDLQNISTIASL